MRGHAGVTGIVHLFADQGGRGTETNEAFAEALRIAEALLFAASDPLSESVIARHMPSGIAIAEVLKRLQQDYAGRGVRLARVGECWLFRTADDLGYLLSSGRVETRKPSRAAMETLAIIAYHQPATRADIENIRGVAVAKGTLDVLMEAGWVRPRGRRRTPGRPLTYGTTDAFLLHFGLETVADLPGLDELRGAGLLDERLSVGFSMPRPYDGASVEDEDPLEDGEEQELEELVSDGGSSPSERR